MSLFFNLNSKEFMDQNDLNYISNLLQKRIILFSQAVDNDIANVIVGQLLFLDNENANSDIKLFINSRGGSVTAGLAIYDVMQNLQSDVSTICFGLAVSMGAILVTAGEKNKRFAFKNSRMMIHQPLSKVEARCSDMDLQIANVSYFKNLLNEIIAFHTGKTINLIEKDTEHDFFMSTEEAKSYGLIDNILN